MRNYLLKLVGLGAAALIGWGTTPALAAGHHHWHHHHHHPMKFKCPPKPEKCKDGGHTRV